MSPRPKSNTHTSIATFMFHVVHPGSVVYLFSHILFYDIQYLTLVDVLFCSIYGVVLLYKNGFNPLNGDSPEWMDIPLKWMPPLQLPK